MEHNSVLIVVIYEHPPWMLFVLDERSSKYNNGDLIHSILYAIY